MGRKKERIMAFETLQPDTLHAPTERVCRNFVCSEKNVRECLLNEGRTESWKHDPARETEFNALLSYQTELREGLGNIGIDMVSLLPVTLEKSVKSTTPYIYRTMDYSLNKPSVVFGTKKEALQLIQRKIKTKNVVMHYNGVTEKGEFDIARVEEILGTLEEETVEFDIEPIGRGGIEGDMVLVTIFKNCLKS